MVMTDDRRLVAGDVSNGGMDQATDQRSTK
jgi:hypothetical protein